MDQVCFMKQLYSLINQGGNAKHAHSYNWKKRLQELSY